jgi:hypothetical protein
LKAWIGKPQHWFISQWKLDLAFDDPISLMVLLSWYVVIKATLGPRPTLKLSCSFQCSSTFSLYHLCVFPKLNINWVEHLLTILLQPSFGLATKARACKGESQEWAQESHFMLLGVQESAREWTPHSQMNSHFGSWSPNGLLNFQRAITRAKTH